MVTASHHALGLVCHFLRLFVSEEVGGLTLQTMLEMEVKEQAGY